MYDPGMAISGAARLLRMTPGKRPRPAIFRGVRVRWRSDDLFPPGLSTADLRMRYLVGAGARVHAATLPAPPAPPPHQTCLSQELARAHHPDMHPNANQVEQSANQRRFVELTQRYESALSASIDPDAATEEPGAGVTTSHEDALQTFFGVAKDDPAFAMALQKEIASAAQMSQGGLDKGGYWAAAAMLSASGTGTEAIAGSPTPQLPGEAGKARRRRRPS